MKTKPMTGRCCYDHLGGRLGAALLELYLKNGWLEPEEGNGKAYRMTDAGKQAFAGMGLPVETCGDPGTANPSQRTGGRPGPHAAGRP